MNLLLLHLCFCAFLTGLIWTVQILLYPAFRFVEESSFSSFHQRHSSRITWIVGPLMLMELGTAIGLLFQTRHPLALLNLLALAGIWASTALLSVPLHKKLADHGKSLSVIERLVATNWPRTILWTLRFVGLLLAAYQSG